MEVRPENDLQRVGVTRDLSRSGALLALDGRYSVGQRLVLTIGESDPTRRGPRIEGQVVRVQPSHVPGFRWELGVRFAREIPRVLQ